MRGTYPPFLAVLSTTARRLHGVNKRWACIVVEIRGFVRSRRVFWGPPHLCESGSCRLRRLDSLAYSNPSHTHEQRHGNGSHVFAALGYCGRDRAIVLSCGTTERRPAARPVAPPRRRPCTHIDFVFGQTVTLVVRRSKLSRDRENICPPHCAATTLARGDAIDGAAKHDGNPAVVSGPLCGKSSTSSSLKCGESAEPSDRRRMRLPSNLHSPLLLPCTLAGHPVVISARNSARVSVRVGRESTEPLQIEIDCTMKEGGHRRISLQEGGGDTCPSSRTPASRPRHRSTTHKAGIA